MRDWGRLAAVVSAAILVAGCEEVWNSVYREGKLGVVTDAKQRVIISTEADRDTDKRPGHNEPKAIVCAEPSPDVAQAISSALQATVSAESKGTTFSGGFGFAGSAAVAQLGERLATIQLLRDKMYRACEAYANGAVNASGYTLMLARLDKTMVALLTNEMAAGAFGRTLAQIGGSASASGISAKELAQAADDVRKKSADLQQAVKDKKSDKEIEDARKALDDATQKLVRLELAVMHVEAAGAAGATALGQIGGRSSASSSVNALEAVHRTYIDDDGVEPLIDACITSVEHTAIQFLDTAQLSDLGETLASIRAQNAIVAELFAKERIPDPKLTPNQLSEFSKARREAQSKQSDLHGKLRLKFGAMANYGFAGLCLNEILRGDSAYLDKRHEHELNLRKLSQSVRQAELNAQAEKLAICKTLLADTKLTEAQRGEIIKSCATLLARD